jgi:hypothetical protein
MGDPNRRRQVLASQTKWADRDRSKQLKSARNSDAPGLSKTPMKT